MNDSINRQGSGREPAVKGRQACLRRICRWWQQEPAQRTALGFESLADLEFALMLWRQNLKRDLACTDAKEVQVPTCS